MISAIKLSVWHFFFLKTSVTTKTPSGNEYEHFLTPLSPSSYSSFSFRWLRETLCRSLTEESTSSGQNRSVTRSTSAAICNLAFRSLSISNTTGSFTRTSSISFSLSASHLFVVPSSLSRPPMLQFIMTPVMFVSWPHPEGKPVHWYRPHLADMASCHLCSSTLLSQLLQTSQNTLWFMISIQGEENQSMGSVEVCFLQRVLNIYCVAKQRPQADESSEFKHPRKSPQGAGRSLYSASEQNI